LLVALTFDERYAVAARNLLTSIARASRPRSPMNIVALLPQETNQQTIVELDAHARCCGLSLAVLTVDADFSGLPTPSYLSTAIYLRLLLPRLLPEEPQLLYLDVDAVVAGDLEDLASVDCGRAPLAAVRDLWHPILASALAQSDSSFTWARNDVPYFNSGIMVMNLEAWRDDRLGERAIDLLRGEGRHLTFADQDALNLLVGGRWLQLDPRWNVLPMQDYRAMGVDWPFGGGMSAAEIALLEREAFVLHFAGPHKPWRDDYPASPTRLRYRRLSSTNCDGGPGDPGTISPDHP
jgi:lipopolysaccharide biosynthesis glycosyltransferase